MIWKFFKVLHFSIFLCVFFLLFLGNILNKFLIKYTNFYFYFSYFDSIAAISWPKDGTCAHPFWSDPKIVWYSFFGCMSLLLKIRERIIPWWVLTKHFDCFILPNSMIVHYFYCKLPDVHIWVWVGLAHLFISYVIFVLG